MVQVAELGGVYLISLLLCASNLCVYLLLIKGGLSRILAVMVLSCIIGFQVFYGLYSIKRPIEYVSKVPVSLLQPNIPQELKWNPEYQKATLNKLLELTKKASREKDRPELVIWPETAVPFFFQDESDFTGAIKDTIKALNIKLLLGSPAYEKDKSRIYYYNRAYLYDPNMNSLDFYDKIRLVPFGEYIPIGFLAPLVEKIIGSLGEFKVGSKPNVIAFDGIKMGMLICYEAIFPYLSDKAKKHGAQVLVNITNDAWFGKSSAPYQHFYMSVLRSIENRIPLVRCANTGISGIIDEKGNVLAKTDIFEEASISTIINIPVCRPTLYNKYGYTMPYVILIIFVSYLAFIFVRERYILKKDKVHRDQREFKRC